MEVIDITGKSKIAARLINLNGRIKRQIVVIVSQHSPGSIALTKSLPKTQGWKVALDVPLRYNGRKNYEDFLKRVKAKEVWIKVSTAGGKSKVYIR
jgi:hypothetical protein